jgi:uncharacterized protein (DUF2062 family)
MSRPYSVTVLGDARRSPARWRRNAASDSSIVTFHRYHGGPARGQVRGQCPVAAHLAADDRARIVWRVQASRAQTTGRRPLSERARELLRAALVERSSPRGIGQSVAAGVFAGCTPLGFHGAIALALATAFRLNRLIAFAASHLSILPVYLAILFCEVEVGHLLRRGQFAHLTPGEAFDHRYELLTESLLGTLVVGAALGATLGLVAYVCARSLQRSSYRTRLPVSSRTLDGPRPPSSGSPPSAPPDPSS